MNKKIIDKLHDIFQEYGLNSYKQPLTKERGIVEEIAKLFEKER